MKTKLNKVVRLVVYGMFFTATSALGAGQVTPGQLRALNSMGLDELDHSVLSSEIKAMEAEVHQNKILFDQVQWLYERGAASREEFEQAQASFKGDEAKLKLTQAEETENSSSASLNGVILRLEQGETISSANVAQAYVSLWNAKLSVANVQLEMAQGALSGAQVRLARTSQLAGTNAESQKNLVLAQAEVERDRASLQGMQDKVASTERTLKHFESFLQ